MLEEQQKQEMNARRNLEKLASDDLWKQTITGEVKGLKRDLTKTNAKVDDVYAKLGTTDKRLTSYKEVNQSTPSLDRHTKLLWIAIGVPIGILLSVLGSLAGAKIFFDNQQSQQETSTPAQENLEEPSNASQELGQESVSDAPSISKESANTDLRQEELSTGTHLEYTAVPEATELPTQDPSIQPEPQLVIPGTAPAAELAPPIEAPLVAAEPALSPPKPRSSAVPQSSVPRSIAAEQEWRGTLNQVDPTDSYPMVLYIERIEGSHFTGRVEFETLNTITNVEGEFVTEFGDAIEQSRWSYIEDFSNSRDGIWLKFTQNQIRQGGDLEPYVGSGAVLVMDDWKYAHIRSDGSMVGVAFTGNSRPKADFSLSRVSN